MTFDFFIGGYFHDHSYRIILENNVLNISDYVGLPIPEHGKTVSVDANKEWLVLIEFLERCSWKRRYDSGILDGTQWELTAKGAGININSYGSNAYPDNFGQFILIMNKVISTAGIEVKVS